MGLVAACVYLFILIAFRPFCFYKDIVAVTSRNGQRHITLKLEDEEIGRSHRFPYSKVSYITEMLRIRPNYRKGLSVEAIADLPVTALIIPVGLRSTRCNDYPGNRGRFWRLTLAPQVLHTCHCLLPPSS